MRGCADQVKRVTLELGGKSANIVFADADLERAAATAPYARLRQRGPGLLRALAHPGRSARRTTGSWRCSSRRCAGCGVEDPLAGHLGDGPADLGRAARRRRRRSSPMARPSRSAAPPPRGPATGSRPRCWTPAGRTDRACDRGDLRPGRRRSCRSRTRPTRSALANDTVYGLSGSIWTENLGRALRVSRGVETGNLSVNSPLLGAVLHAVRRASSSPGWAASSARTRWTPSPRSRTSSSTRRSDP